MYASTTIWLCISFPGKGNQAGGNATSLQCHPGLSFPLGAESMRPSRQVCWWHGLQAEIARPSKLGGRDS